MAISTDCKAQASQVVIIPASNADTAACTSAWIDVSAYKGDLVFTHVIGAVTGSITSKLRSATSSGGAGAADITGATFTACTDTTHVQSVVIPATTAKYIQYVGTVVTGPIVMGVILTATTGQAG